MYLQNAAYHSINGHVKQLSGSNYREDSVKKKKKKKKGH